MGLLSYITLLCYGHVIDMYEGRVFNYVNDTLLYSAAILRIIAGNLRIIAGNFVNNRAVFRKLLAIKICVVFHTSFITATTMKTAASSFELINVYLKKY